jgi:phosphoribosyl-ATP pyrophosphohydrolase/phosphoribosyl-AMP cyclohydrolase
MTNVNWNKVNGLLPVIIQDNKTGRVLMLGYMNPEALEITQETRRVTFYSRTKKRLWMKGETSGQVLQVIDMMMDCDEDSLLILANIEGPCCHLNQPSCFGSGFGAFSVLTSLEELIRSRHQERPENHYTTKLFEAGVKRIAQKVGEEGVEVALAATCGNKEELMNEAADLLYHLLVLLVAKQSSLNEVNLLLKQRNT